MRSLIAVLDRLGIHWSVCPVCNAPADAPLCPACRAASGVDTRISRTNLGEYDLVFVGAYRAPDAPSSDNELSPLGRALVRFKDHGDRYAGRSLARLFAAACAPVLPGFDAVVPVPPDPARLRQRGLSPAFWFAHALARMARIPLEPSLLRRTGPRRPQRGLAGAARRANVRGAFAASPSVTPGRAAVVVDDVTTTGATLTEAAQTLALAGATHILCAVVACADEELISRCRSKTARAGTSAIEPAIASTRDPP